MKYGMGMQRIEEPSQTGIEPGASVAKPRRSRKYLLLAQILVGLGLSAVLIWLLFRGLDWESLIETLRAFPIYLFLLALGVFLVGIAARAMRWYILLPGEQLSFLRLFMIQNAGIGLNNLSPVRLVSEPVQLALVVRRGGVNTATALATLVVEHLMDVFAVAVILAISIIALPQLRGFSIQVGTVIILAFFTLVVLFAVAKGMDAVPGSSRLPFLRKALAAVKALGSSPLRLFLSFMSTLTHWGLLSLSGWIIAQGLGIDIPVAAMIVLIMGSVFFVSIVPSAPGGIGTFHGAVVFTMARLGILSEPALVFGFIMHIILFIPSTLVAIIVLPREGIRLFGKFQDMAMNGNKGRKDR